MNFIFDAIVKEVIIPDGVYGRDYDLIVFPSFRDQKFFDWLGPIYPSVVFIIEFGFIDTCLFGNFMDYRLGLTCILNIEDNIVQLGNIWISGY